MKSFFLGVASGIALVLVSLFIIGLVNRNFVDNDQVQYLERPVSYENKTKTSFKVFQVLGDAALAHEISDNDYKVFYGNVAVILGENYYNDQVITIKNPQRIGTYSYTSNGGRAMTVPIVDGDISE